MALNRNNRQKARSAFFGNNSGLETSKYSISIKIRQYPKNQNDPNIKLRRIESACGIINIATFAILLSSSSLYAFKVPEIIVKGIAIFAVCTVIFSLCLILLIQKLIQKLPIDETDNTFRHRLHLWGQNMLKLFSEKIRSIIPAGKKRVVPQQQSTEEHSVVTDSNTKIKNNDETSNIFIAIIFIVTLFLFATTFYINHSTKNRGGDVYSTINTCHWWSTAATACRPRGRLTRVRTPSCPKHAVGRMFHAQGWRESDHPFRPWLPLIRWPEWICICGDNGLTRLTGGERMRSG